MFEPILYNGPPRNPAVDAYNDRIYQKPKGNGSMTLATLIEAQRAWKQECESLLKTARESVGL